MDKAQFLEELRGRLAGLPRSDLDERLQFYGEMIDDRMEDGLSETEAVAGIGSVDEVVAQIMEEIPLSKLVREKVKRSRGLKAWEIVLLVLGSPVWLPLGIAAFAVGVVGCVPWLPWLKKRISGSPRLVNLFDLLGVIAAVAVLALSVFLLIGGTYNPFIYFRF